MYSLRCVLVCSLNVLVLFSHRILWYRLISFSYALYLHLVWLCVLLPFFLVGSDQIFSDDFWKSIIQFRRFFAMLTVFWCSILFTALVVFWMEILESKIVPAHWGSCSSMKCVSGLQRLEKLELHVMHTILGSCAQMLFRHKWRKRDKYVAFFIVLVNVDARLSCMSFSCKVFKFWLVSFSYCTFSETFAVLLQKWINHQWI